ncbi:hypothetical protein L596_022661 [Steinernema carpocapsae]|uniref:Uncharacterized protein n=1 Tax=Steinernema carpocapsae TaxID=34508 RepID=A0A4V6XVX7_STECR|nr:hypothetical protein L596_022661 [Steinernema carpocapsae]
MPMITHSKLNSDMGLVISACSLSVLKHSFLHAFTCRGYFRVPVPSGRPHVQGAEHEDRRGAGSQQGHRQKRSMPPSESLLVQPHGDHLFQSINVAKSRRIATIPSPIGSRRSKGKRVNLRRSLLRTSGLD